MRINTVRMLLMATISSALLVFCCGFDGCFNSPSPTTSGGGFPLASTDTIQYGFGGVIVPHPGASITGTWLADDDNATGSVKYFPPTTTDYQGLAYVTNGRYYADWQSTVRWNNFCVDETTQTQYFIDVQPSVGIEWTCVQPPSATGAADTHFALQGALPTTFTAYSFGNSALSPTAPTALYVYNRSGSLLNAISATSIASDGSSATFPFPSNSNGSALTPDIYGLSLVQNSSTENGLAWVAIGGADTSLSQPFGVAAVGGTSETTICHVIRGTSVCTTASSGDYYYPVVTLYGTSTVSVEGNSVQVGTNPTTVLAYDNAAYTTTTGSQTEATSVTRTGPSRALVVNTGSGSVSIVDLNRLAVLATINVGLSPIAATLSPDQTTAYVANYGSGTVSVINLSSLQVTSTLSVGGTPLSLSLDNQGNLWVGEANSIVEIALSSASVVNTVAMPGPVTSLAYSDAQGELISTVEQDNGNIQADVFPRANLASSSSTPSPLISNSAGYSADYVASASHLGNIPNPQALATGTLVSNDSQNSLTVSATSTGFIVTDLTLQEVVMQGSTTGPVTSIAVDPMNQVAYLTVPSQNLVITLPLPYVPLN